MGIKESKQHSTLQARINTDCLSYYMISGVLASVKPQEILWYHSIYCLYFTVGELISYLPSFHIPLWGLPFCHRAVRDLSPNPNGHIVISRLCDTQKYKKT